MAGHQDSKLDDDAARTIAETREYLDVAEELLSTEKTLWATARGVYGIREHPGENPVQFIAAGWL